MAYDTIEQAHVIAWDTALQQTAQQAESRLQPAITTRDTVEGESFTHNWMGDTEMDEVTDRLGDTILSEIEHKTPQANMRDFFKALPLAREDIPKMKINPVATGDYMSALVKAYNRKKDEIIYNAMIGSQLYKDGSTEAVPAGQKILHGSTGFTKAKLIQTRKIFRANEVDSHSGEELYIAYNDAMLEDILADTTLTSAEFMAVKMLQAGDLADSWMGFKWIPYNALSVSGSTVTTVAWAKSAIKMGEGYMEGDMARRADKRNAWQVSMAGSLGALRTEAKRLVLIEFQ